MAEKKKKQGTGLNVLMSLRLHAIVVLLLFALLLPTIPSFIVLNTFSNFMNNKANEYETSSIEATYSLLDAYLSSSPHALIKGSINFMKSSGNVNIKEGLTTLKTVAQKNNIKWRNPNYPTSIEEVLQTMEALSRMKNQMGETSFKNASGTLNILRYFLDVKKASGTNITAIVIQDINGGIIKIGNPVLYNGGVFRKGLGNTTSFITLDAKDMGVNLSPVAGIIQGYKIGNVAYGTIEIEYNFTPMENAMDSFILKKKDTGLIIGTPIVWSKNGVRLNRSRVAGQTVANAEAIKKENENVWNLIKDKITNIANDTLVSARGIDQTNQRPYTLVAMKKGNYIIGYKLYDEYFADFKSVKSKVITMIVIIVIITLGVAIFFAIFPFIGLKEIEESVDKIVKGDLTVKIPNKNKYYEINILVNAIKNLVQAMREFISMIVHVVYSMNVKSKQLFQNVENTEDNLQQLESVVDNLVKSATHQAREVSKQAEVVNDINQNIEEIVTEVSAIVEDLHKNDIDENKIAALIEKLEEHRDKLAELGIDETVIDDLKEIVKHSSNIDVISERVSKIFDSMNNMSLNLKKLTSSIEGLAALAEELSASAEEVSASVSEMVEGSRQLRELAQEMENDAEEFVKAVEKYKI